MEFYTRLTLLAAGLQAPVFLVQREPLVTRLARGRVASNASRRTGQTFVTFLIRIVEVRAFGIARAFQFKITRLARYTLIGSRSGTRFTVGGTGATPAIVIFTQTRNVKLDRKFRFS